MGSPQAALSLRLEPLTILLLLLPPSTPILDSTTSYLEVHQPSHRPPHSRRTSTSTRPSSSTPSLLPPTPTSALEQVQTALGWIGPSSHGFLPPLIWSRLLHSRPLPPVPSAPPTQSR